jgi:soluble lytic murein transglycosylase-like protein
MMKGLIFALLLAMAPTAFATTEVQEPVSCYACNERLIERWQQEKLHRRFTNDIVKISKQYGVDPALVKAIIHSESSFNPKAKSHLGAQGLMQLMPATAEWMNVKNPFDPRQNIRGGVKYLSYLLKRFDGDVVRAVAAYNAGPGNVNKYKGVPPFKETKHYLDRVMTLKDRYTVLLKESV